MSNEPADDSALRPSVSRETSTPLVPLVARGVFGVESLALAERYAHLLATEGVTRGLIGPKEAPRLWDRHLVNCALLAAAIPLGSTVCDVGSGAGLPGIVLAIVRQDLKITLCEPLLRRTQFLSEVVELLGLDGVRVVRGRADSLHGVHRYDVVTSRAVAPLPQLLEWSMPLVAPTGVLLALKGSTVYEEIEGAAPDLAAWDCGVVDVLVLSAPGVEPPTFAVRVPWADPSSVSWPATRSAGTWKSTPSGPPRKRGRQRDR